MVTGTATLAFTVSRKVVSATVMATYFFLRGFFVAWTAFVGIRSKSKKESRATGTFLFRHLGQTSMADIEPMLRAARKATNLTNYGTRMTHVFF